MGVRLGGWVGFGHLGVDGSCYFVGAVEGAVRVVVSKDQASMTWWCLLYYIKMWYCEFSVKDGGSVGGVVVRQRGSAMTKVAQSVKVCLARRS